MTIYLTEELKRRYPHIFAVITGMLDLKDIEWKTLEGSNLWIRDYMPIRTNSHYTKFVYKMEDPNPWPQLRVPPEVWHPFCDAESPLILDGGNVEKSAQVVLMSEIVLRHNPGVEYRKLVSSLETTFHREVVFLPVEPWDILGHMDGIARFVDDRTVLVNDYCKRNDIMDQRFMEEIHIRLNRNGFEVVYLPNAYHLMPEMSERQFRTKYPLADDENPGYGYYLNFFKIGSLLFMPVFNIKEDNEAYKILHQCFPHHEIVPVNCSDLSMEGGLCNCITWEHE